MNRTRKLFLAAAATATVDAIATIEGVVLEHGAERNPFTLGLAGAVGIIPAALFCWAVVILVLSMALHYNEVFNCDRRVVFVTMAILFYFFLGGVIGSYSWIYWKGPIAVTAFAAFSSLLLAWSVEGFE